MIPAWPWRTPCLSILIYHRVAASPQALFPGAMHARLFERQLSVLKRFFTVLPLELAVCRLQDGSLPQRAACITFDDGYADNASVALPLLQKYGLPACFFISTGYLDGGRMWNDDIIEAVRDAPDACLDLSALGLAVLPIATLAERRSAIATIIAKLKYLPFSRRQAIAAQLHAQSSHPAAPPLMMSSAQVRTLQQAGMSIGAHTVSHPILSSLSEPAARAEIANGKRQLEECIQAPVTLFAYPNGKLQQDYGPLHAQIVKSLGFTAAASTDPGAARHGDDLFHLPRYTPWRPGALGFLLQLQQNRYRHAPCAP
ncbi:polysaccharide deacetylase family protein [Janthinobacterium agaricidamnosum]|uniref:Polysaccharide deacetylase family protein n=1 Tax=Janthinobacterium agaricidamnosum NBRC 102515 = DSM 9628 TaxID=1349767 RepID=W0V6P7_9BURK|nr:polysaccharide deacetylase family protein [Janthinobacterium agaricidamnosum]CDG83290.1 polysaccharide deacetylase family protein [Janthinobacterium agaricidamnosum NBRC 102515 = DSM 9628]